MRIHAKNLDTFMLCAVGVCIAGTVLAEGSSRQGKPSSKASHQSEKTPTTAASESSPVIETVQAPAETTRVEQVNLPLAVSPTAPSSAGVPSVSLNEILVPRKPPQLVPISYEFSYGTPSHSHVQNKRPDAPDGQHRTVDYVADKEGFRAGVATNEPGTETALEGAGKIVSSAVSGVDSALKFGPRHHVKDVQLAKQVQLSTEAGSRPETPSSAVNQISHHVQISSPQQDQHHLSPVHLIPAEGSPEFTPLRIVDIQPLPPPLIRFARFEHPPPPPIVEVIPPQPQIPRHSSPETQIVPRGQAPLALESLPPPLGDQGVATVVKPVTYIPTVPTSSPVTVVNPPPQFAASAQIITHFPPRVEVIQPQPAFLHRPLVHTVSEISRPSPPDALSPGPPHLFSPINFSIDQLQPQFPQRLVAQAGLPTAQPPTRIEIIRPATVNTGFTPFESVQQLLTPGPVQTVGKNIVRLPSIQPTKDAQIFEVKTKIIPAGGTLPPMQIPPTVNDNVIILPQHNSRHTLGQPKPEPHGDFSAVKVGDFASARHRLPHPEDILKNLPPPMNRPPPPPPPPPGPIRSSEPIIFLAIPPPATLSTSSRQRRPRPHHPELGNNESIRKFFGDLPSASEHDIAVNRFFSNIKQHHLNEVKMVKKHEEHLQSVASRVMPFFRVRPVLRPRAPKPATDLLSLLR